MAYVPSQKDLDKLDELIDTSTELNDAQKKFYDPLWRKKFLTCFKNVDEAFKAIIANAKWRAEFDFESLSPEKDEVIRANKAANKVIFTEEKDKQGRPIGLIKVKNHDPKDKDIDKFMRFIVWVFEEALKRCTDADNFCVVLDLDGFSKSYFDVKTVQAAMKFKKVAIEHYPERLGVCLMINAPFIFKAFWSFIKPVIPEEGRKKYSVVTEEELKAYFDPEILKKFSKL